MYFRNIYLEGSTIKKTKWVISKYVVTTVVTSEGRELCGGRGFRELNGLLVKLSGDTAVSFHYHSRNSTHVSCRRYYIHISQKKV